MWGENTDGDHCEGYRLYVTKVKQIPINAKRLEFYDRILNNEL